MADAMIAATVRMLLQNAISFASDRIVSAVGLEKDVEALQNHAKDVQAALADAETKQSRSLVVLRWLEKVEEVSFEADNVLDELLYESLRRQVKSRDQSRLRSKVSLFSLSKHDVSFRLSMSSKVRDINKKLKVLNLESLGIGLIRRENSVVSYVEVVRGRQTDSLPLPFVAGRAREESELVNMLLSGSRDRNVSVLAIVGMGGLGKTTLAKSVYNNKKIHNSFAKKVWICVSGKLEVTEIFRRILESLKGENYVQLSSRDAIVQQIQIELDGKRFLFVLDDMWNEDPKLWDDFFNSLVALSIASGSCCVLTTRLHTTANLVSTFDPYVLGKLSDDECWSILVGRATKGGLMPAELMVHRDQILRICQGLPLAANAIGGLLCLQKREDWLSVVKNEILKISEDLEGEIMPILRLSFDNLASPAIKKCFSYCSVFAKDDKNMDGEKLIQLWMALGYLREDAGRGTTMEEIGSNYLRILLQSSLLEKVTILKRDYYQMHDLVYDLAKSHVRNHRFDRVKTSSAWQVDILQGDVSSQVLLKFKYVHVLNLDGEKAKKLTRGISKMKHLRYLVLSGFSIELFPDSFWKLYNLQTLRLEHCYIPCLPPRMSNMVSLRHLHFFTRDNTFPMPLEMGRLTCLQTLQFFNVGEEKGRKIEELGSMKNLKGELEVRNLELVKGKEGARLANLFEKQNLVQLNFFWGSTYRENFDDCDEHALEGLEPHPNLKNLKLKNFIGAQFPRWFQKRLGLVKLELVNCPSCIELPALGHLPYLEELEFRDLVNVVCIGASFYNVEDCREGKVFPALRSMKLVRMTRLAEWKELEAMNDSGVFFKLESLVIANCSKLTTAPTYFPSLHALEITEIMQNSVVEGIIGKSASSLKNLSLGFMSGLRSVSDVIKNSLIALEKLEIDHCEGLTEMPSSTLECCTSLESLSVSRCPNLVSCPLDFKQTPSLSILCFRDFPTTNATSMIRGFKHLSNLRRLSMNASEMIDWHGLQACSSTLLKLSLYGSCFKSSLLPEQLQSLISLEELRLDGFKSIEELPDWLGNLASLRVLVVFSFPKLRRLTSPDAMARLTNLRTLAISRCPMLRESWDGRSDPHSVWFKVSHLQNLRVIM